MVNTVGAIRPNNRLRHHRIVIYPPPHDYDGGHATVATSSSERRYSRIADDCNSAKQVAKALASAGLESSNLIDGVDFTKSNEWTGKRSLNRPSLHHICSSLNPYEQAISIIGKTLAPFNKDNLIPCFGFGDASIHDQDVFGFYPDDTFCNGFEEVLRRCREIVPHLRLAGPTSFAPVVEMAMTIVQQSVGQYHVLVIIADDQVTGSVDTERGKLSPQEQKTIDAIVKASSQKGNSPHRVALPPPVYGASSSSSSKPVYGGASSFSGSKPSSHSTSFVPIVPPYHVDSIHDSLAPPSPSSTYDD